MKENLPIDKILEIAIRKEQEARAFYLDLGKRVQDPAVRETLEFLAGEEAKHQEFLEKYRRGELAGGALALSTVVDYRILEHLEEGEAPDLSGPLTPEQAFLVAARREQASHEVYLRLSHMHPPGPARDLLEKMANEELRHKEKVEYLYANTAFPQTSGG